MKLSPQELRDIVRASRLPEEVQAAAWSMANRAALSDDDARALVERLRTTPETEVDVLKTILWALMLRRDHVPVDLFAHYATTHSAEEVRQAAIRTLGTLRCPASTTVLTRVASQDPVARNRRQAVVFLSSQVKGDAGTSLARAALQREMEPEVRMRWVTMLGFVGTRAAKEALEHVLRSRDEPMSVRLHAAEVASFDLDHARMLAVDHGLAPELRARLSEVVASDALKAARAG
jgi:hypothetical protein